jgi:putative hydrolase of the HAD superfamily
MDSIKVIFFDAVGTLFWVRGTVGEIYSRFALSAGVAVDAADLNRAFMHCFRAAPRAEFPNASDEQLPKLEYDWWKAIARQSFAKVGVLEKLGDFEVFFHPLYDHFALADPWIVYPEVHSVLQSLAQNFELGIISNFDTRLHQVLKVLGLADYFSSITLSTVTGVAKPKPGVFQAALAKHQCIPEAAIHVGDDWTEDYQGALTARLQGVWLNREGQTQSATLEIADLAALHRILPDKNKPH